MRGTFKPIFVFVTKWSPAWKGMTRHFRIANLSLFTMPRCSTKQMARASGDRRQEYGSGSSRDWAAVMDRVCSASGQ